MSKHILYHNPRCSKSRQTLAMLEERGIDVQVHRYLDDPLDVASLRQLEQRLDGGIATLLRTTEAEWKALDADPTDREAVLEALASHPKLMQRPILDRGDRAVVGRPPENVLVLVDS